MRSGKKYTQVELDFIKAHADLRPRQLAELFNITFNRSAEPKRMSQYLRQMGIEPNIRREHKYNEEQVEWLVANIPTMGEKELTAAFNARYGVDVSVDSLNTYAMKYTTAKRTQETKRRTKSKALRKYQAGELRVHKRGGHKVTVMRIETDGNFEWVPYGRYLWEQKYGKLPEGYVVVFLNGDGTDCRIENMYAASPGVTALMARNRWYSSDPELTKTALMLCELSRITNGTIRV